jgi:hypothetical protein
LDTRGLWQRLRDAGQHRRSGLANLAERAWQLAATLHAGPPSDDGTELRWQV